MNLRLYSTTHIWRTMLLGLTLLIVSCGKDPIGKLQEKPAQDPGIPVMVQISFRVPKFSYPQAAANRTVPDGDFLINLESATVSYANSENETASRTVGEPLYNLWVLQFKPDGKIHKVVRVSTTDEPVYENQTIDVELMTGSDQTIYMLSLGKQYGDIDLSGIKSMSELESTTFNFVRYENGIPLPIIKDAADVPYRGSCDKLTIIKLEESGAGYVDYRNSPGFTGAINMKALISQITIDLSYKVDGMTPFSVSLNNVPTTFVVNDASYKPSQFVNLPTVMLNPADLANGKRSTFSWYAAPNRQGVVPTIRTEADRYFYYKPNTSTTVGTAPSDGTFIHFWASKDATPNNYALYYLFMGSNTTNDFNIHPNSLYRYRTDINTADALNDKRILFQTLEQMIDFSASSYISGKRESNATLPTPTNLRYGVNYDLDVHPDMRPMEITALRGTISVEILGAKDDTSPINTEASWLKLSTYSNYTAALNGKLDGDATALATSITLNASIPGLFRLYLYSDEFEKYVFDNPNNANYKRSLFVRFTFRTETDKFETYVVRMDQMPGFYAGQYGGEIDMTASGASYPMGLVMEAKEEYGAKIKYLNYYAAFNLYLAYDYLSLADNRRYHLYDNYNGRKATILTAENEYGLSPIATRSSNKIVDPRYVGDHVDLYQYKHYTGDVFSQRYCYDKNRDMNGNGYLDDTPDYTEIVWYVPANAQILPLGLNYYDTKNTISGLNIGSNVQCITMETPSSVVSYDLSSLQSPSSGIGNRQNIRCVRDVPIDNAGAGGVKMYVDDKNYAVIDASGLMAGVAETRVNNPSVTTADGRVIRHYIGSTTSTLHEIDRKVSIRFRVAPRDIKANGKLADINAMNVPIPTYLTWAEAAGYFTEANTLPATDPATSADTGCSAYEGNGSAADVGLGKWRLPTLRESLLIAMMDEAMAATNSVTGYFPLNVSKTNWLCYYWTATELEDGTDAYSKNRAVTLGSSYKDYNGPPIIEPSNQYARDANNLQKGAALYQQPAARCIQDLP